MVGGWRGKKKSPPEKNLIATKRGRRTGKLSHCLKSSVSHFLKITDNIFICFLNIARLSHVTQVKMLISGVKVLKSLSGSLNAKK